LTQETAIKALMNLKLSLGEAKAYLYLAINGPQKATELANVLKTHKKQVYRSLRGLQRKGYVSVAYVHTCSFKAEPFEKIVDLSIKIKNEEAQTILLNKQEIISQWKSMMEKESTIP